MKALFGRRQVRLDVEEKVSAFEQPIPACGGADMIGRKVGGEAIEEGPLVDDRRIVADPLNAEPQALRYVLSRRSAPDDALRKPEKRTPFRQQ